MNPIPNLLKAGHALIQSDAMMAKSAISTKSEKLMVILWNRKSCSRCFLTTASMSAVGAELCGLAKGLFMDDPV